MTIIETKPVSTVKMTDRSVVAACPLGMSLSGTGVSGRLLPMFSASSVVLEVVRERSERPVQAPAVAVAAVAQVQAYAFAATTNGAGTNGHMRPRRRQRTARRAEDAAQPEVGLPRARTLE